MIPIQNRQLACDRKGEGRIHLSWSLLESDPPDSTFFLEHMVHGTWRFPNDVTTVDATTFELTVEGEGPQQYRVIGPDGSPSETLIVDPAGLGRPK